MNINNNAPAAHKQNPKTNPNGDGTVYLLKNGKWKAEYVIGYDSQTGMPIRPSKTSKNKGVVNDWLAEQKNKYGKSKGAIDRSKKLFKDAAEGYFKQQIMLSEAGTLSSHTVSLRIGIFNKHIAPNIGCYRLSDITTEVLQQLLDNLKNNNLTRTVGISKTIIVKVFEFAIKQNYCKDNPTNALKLPPKTDLQKKQKKARKKARCINEDLQEEIMTRLNNNPLINTVIRIMLDTGLRIGEVLALTWNDINFRTHEISVTKALVTAVEFNEKNEVISRFTKIGNPKSEDSNRKVPIAHSLEAVLKNWNSIQKERYSLINKDDFVFRNRNGAHYTVSGFRSNTKRFFKKYELYEPGLCHHSFRHAYATNLLNAGIPLSVISALLGHADIAITINYIGPDNNTDKLQVANSMDSIIAERNAKIRDFKNNSAKTETAIKQQ